MAEAQEIPVIDVMVVAPEGFESDVSAARLISDASKIYESNGLLSLRFAGLVRLPPIPELLSGDLGAILSGRTPALQEVRRDVERERLCRRADLVLIWVSASDSPHVAGRGFLFHGRDFGYSIVATSSGKRRVNLPRAVAHEIGHNLGLPRNGRRGNSDVLRWPPRGRKRPAAWPMGAWRTDVLERVAGARAHDRLDGFLLRRAGGSVSQPARELLRLIEATR